MSAARSASGFAQATQLEKMERVPRRWVLGSMLVFVVIVIAACVVSIGQLRQQADSAQHNEVTQLTLSAAVQQLNGLEWQAADQLGLSAQDLSLAQRVNTSVVSLARAAAREPSTGVERSRLVALAREYSRAVEEELFYYQSYDPAEAHTIDRTRTDPTAAKLQALVAAATANAERVSAGRSSKASNLTLAIAIIGGIATLLLLWRLDRGLLATRRAALLSEQAMRLSEQASHDVLTGLPNRRQLLLDLQQAFDQERACALAFFDLDGFKAYNDTFGHIQGDLLLTRMGERLASAAGEGHGYRLGGDEFCALLADDRRLEPSLAGIRAALREEGDSVFVAASCGVVHLPAEARTVTDALRLADTRMYEHKRGGRSSVLNQTADLARAVIAEHDRGLHAHAGRVAQMAVGIGRQLQLDDAQLAELQRAAELHDIGKVGVPKAILDRPGPLGEQEQECILQHTLIGERILACAPALAGVASIVRSTHERYDGAGYPDRLAGEQIPLLSRIVFVCDAWDAMTGHERPYRERLTSQQAQEELQRHAGTQFDPAVVSAAFRVIEAQRREADGAGVKLLA